jgi:hypothetical protein
VSDKLEILSRDTELCEMKYNKFKMIDKDRMLVPSMAEVVEFFVRHELDPVVNFDESDVESTSAELEIAGLLIVIFSSLMVIALLVYLIHACRGTKHSSENIEFKRITTAIQSDVLNKV